jgi:hypothetical protein
MSSVLFFFHMLGLAMAVGAGLSMFILGRAAAPMEPPDRVKYMLRAFAIMRMGQYGFLILIVTGLGLLFPILAAEGVNAFFMVKMGLVFLQLLLVILMMTWTARAKAENGGPIMASIPKLGRILTLNAILIVASAVLAFH